MFKRIVIMISTFMLAICFCGCASQSTVSDYTEKEPQKKNRASKHNTYSKNTRSTDCYRKPK